MTARNASVFDDQGRLLHLGAAVRYQPRTFGVLFRYDY